MFYWLPGMVIGNGAWATTHFNPDLKVEVFGVTAANKEALSATMNAAPLEQLIGRWQDVTMGMMLVHEGSTYIMESSSDRKYKPIREKLFITHSGSRAKYIIRNNTFGEYYALILKVTLRYTTVMG